MSEFLIVVAAVSAPFLIGSFVTHYFRYRSAVAKRAAAATAEQTELENARLRSEVAELRERVEVLEAIVTDRKYELGRKIANL